jgi:hypothetical protein
MNKRQITIELEAALKKYFKNGGTVEFIETRRKAPSQTMTCKPSRSFMAGATGAPNGYPRKSSGMR